MCNKLSKFYEKVAEETAEEVARGDEYCRGVLDSIFNGEQDSRRQSVSMLPAITDSYIETVESPPVQLDLASSPSLNIFRRI